MFSGDRKDWLGGRAGDGNGLDGPAGTGPGGQSSLSRFDGRIAAPGTGELGACLPVGTTHRFEPAAQLGQQFQGLFGPMMIDQQPRQSCRRAPGRFQIGALAQERQLTDEVGFIRGSEFGDQPAAQIELDGEAGERSHSAPQLFDLPVLGDLRSPALDFLSKAAAFVGIRLREEFTQLGRDDLRHLDLKRLADGQQRPGQTLVLHQVEFVLEGRFHVTAAREACGHQSVKFDALPGIGDLGPVPLRQSAATGKVVSQVLEHRRHSNRLNARIGLQADGVRQISKARIGLPTVEAHPGRLTASVPSPRSRLELRVTTGEQNAVAVTYADPSGGTRAVRHAALASVELTVRGRGGRLLTLSSSCGAYEYGTRQDGDGIVPQPLPEG